MSNLRTIHDAITGEITTVELTKAELAERAQAKKDAEAHAAAQTAKQATRQAVLDKLKLTADEANALLG
jgi:hypothetical protein